MSKPLQVSNNTLATVAKCSTATVLRYGLMRETAGEAPALKAGSAVHSCLEVWWKGGTRKEALRALRQEYKEWAEATIDPEDKYQGRFSWENIRKIMGYVLERYPVSALPFTVDPNLVEVSFAIPLSKSGDIELIGLMDAGPVRDKKSKRLYGVDHKAQPLTANVLTPTGWRLMASLREGDEITGFDGEPAYVRAIYPQGELASFRVTMSDRSVTHCSLDHLWRVQTRTGEWKTMTLKEIIDAPDYARFRLPIHAPIEFDPLSVELPLQPYLLGALIGDGFLAGNSISFSSAEEEMVELVEDELPADTYIHKSEDNNHSWSIVARDRSEGTNSVLRAIKMLGLFGSKSETHFIPEEYMRASVEDRIALLQGLLDTDGCAYEANIYFDSVSLQLTTQVVDLVRSLGGVAHWRRRTGTKQQAYRTTICFGPEITPFRLQRKIARLVERTPTRRIASIEPAGLEEMQCIETSSPDGLYITDDYIVTHNTTGGITAPWFLPQFRMGSQMTGYLWAMREMVPEKVIGMYVNAIQLSKLPYLANPERKCRDHGMAYEDCWAEHVTCQLILIERTPEQVATWKRDAIRLARRYLDLLETYPTAEHLPKVPQEGKFNGSCTMCDYQEFCFAGRPVDRLDVMTKAREERAEWRV